MLSMDSIMAVKDHLPGYVAHWIYSEHGRPMMLVARYVERDGKTFRQFRTEDDEWVEGMPIPPYPLYGLDSLKNVGPLGVVIITEGEKCASLLHQLSWPAIATVLGAQNPGSSDWAPLRHFNRFLILRDNDKSGISFARTVSAQLRRSNPDCEVQVVNLTPRLAGGDVVDWVQDTVMRGSAWDGLSSLDQADRDRVAPALLDEIRRQAVNVEECPSVAFKPIEAQFEGDPIVLSTQLRTVPPFPLEVFPDKVQAYISHTAAGFSQVPDYAATTFLTVASGLIGRSILLQMRPSKQWVEAANSWAMLVGRPSAKKSPTMRRIMALLRALEEAAAADCKREQAQYKVKLKEAERSKEEFDMPPPNLRRYITDDATVPKLRALMAANPRGLILRNDELKGQLERLEKTGSEGDRSFMMSCWSGLEYYSEDRMCRESLINIPLALTWIGCIPPHALQRYIREAMGRGSGADGFMQRFQFVCYPDESSDFQLSDAVLAPEIEQAMKDLFPSLDRAASTDGGVLCFSEEAQELFDQWLKALELEARSGRHPEYWESHLGKQAKVVAVCSIVLHCMAEATSGSRTARIQLSTLQKALKLQAYYLEHARRCYESVTGATMDDARAILQLLRDHRLAERFKAQDIYHKGLGGLSDSQRVRAALDLLVDSNWLVCEKVPAGPQGGRKHEFWTLHPRAFDTF